MPMDRQYSMYTWLEHFIINATPAWRVLLAAFCSTPFFILILGMNALAIGNDDIRQGVNAQALVACMGVVTLSTFLNLGLITHLWPQREQAAPHPKSTLAIIESIGMGFSALAIVMGQVTTSVMVILLGVLAVGLWLFERKPMVIGYFSVVLVLVSHEVGALLGWWAYAPALSPEVYVKGTAAYWWFAVNCELIFVFGWGIIIALLWLLIGSIESVTDQLAKLSNTDALTGLPNRRAFMESLDMELARQTRTGQPLSVVLIDADHFKHINDQHGHDMGDQVLSRIANLLGNCVRQPLDMAARLGGEEFVLLLPETDMAQAITVCTRLQNLLLDQTFGAAPKRFRVTLSMGVVQIRTPCSIEAVMKAVDEQLYLAKSQGRDRVCSADMSTGGVH
jgi:diguanylate cyclase (GGDEF)-like protein